jgi:hypothetical protein
MYAGDDIPFNPSSALCIPLTGHLCSSGDNCVNKSDPTRLKFRKGKRWVLHLQLNCHKVCVQKRRSTPLCLLPLQDLHGLRGIKEGAPSAGGGYNGSSATEGWTAAS